MKLTIKESLDISIELWTRMERYGCKTKRTWLGWKKYGRMFNDCPLCEYVGVDVDDAPKDDCDECPLGWGYIGCERKDDSGFRLWETAKTKEDREKYAGLFLEQLIEIREAIK